MFVFLCICRSSDLERATVFHVLLSFSRLQMREEEEEDEKGKGRRRRRPKREEEEMGEHNAPYFVQDNPTTYFINIYREEHEEVRGKT
jgi:hypothetical protein